MTRFNNQRPYKLLVLALMLFIGVFSGSAGSNTNNEPGAIAVSSNSDGSLDIDGNGELDALTDGLVILRGMFGLSGSQLIQGAIGDEAIYTDSADIAARITALGDNLDIDNDGNVDALSDGLLILRYLFGLTDDPLTTGVVSDDAQRYSAADIEEYLLQLGTFDTSSPVFTSSATFSAAENQTAIGTVTATDADSSSITFSVSGSELAITSGGVLSFQSAPDYETKASYTATVTATDGWNPNTQSITVNVTDANDAPVFISSSTFSAPENQTSIGSVIATDADGDTVSYLLTGTDASSLSVNSSTGVLTFNSSPDYETKSTYSATVTASDGVDSNSQSFTINVTDVPENVTGEAFTGKAVDGYVSGANIFIDQNFNLKHDSGEYAGVSDPNGAFSITVDSSIASCLKARPIIANVPVGAVDSTLGTVTQAYQMILPSINDTGASSIVISPFTSLFSEAILNAKSNLKEDLTVDEGCSSSGDDVASTISSRIDSLKLSISNSFGISFFSIQSA